MDFLFSPNQSTWVRIITALARFVVRRSHSIASEPGIRLVLYNKLDGLAIYIECKNKSHCAETSNDVMLFGKLPEPTPMSQLLLAHKFATTVQTTPKTCPKLNSYATWRKDSCLN